MIKVFFILTLLATAIYADKCGGNCPGGNCPSCPCGTTALKADVDAACRKHSWSQTCCKCIVGKESGGNAHAMGYNTNGTFDVGLFQINKVNWSCNSGNAPCDVDSSIKCAIKVYDGAGGKWRPWSTAHACGCV